MFDSLHSNAISLLCEKPKGYVVYCSQSPFGYGYSSKSCSKVLALSFQRDFRALYTLVQVQLLDTYLACCSTSYSDIAINDKISLIFAILAERGYPLYVLQKLFDSVADVHLVHDTSHTTTDATSVRTNVEVRYLKEQEQHQQECIKHARLNIEEVDNAHASWPQVVPESTVLACVHQYHENIKYKCLDFCCCYGSEDQSCAGKYLPLAEVPDLSLLCVTDPYILKHSALADFTYLHPSLDGYLFHSQNHGYL